MIDYTGVSYEQNFLQVSTCKIFSPQHGIYVQVRKVSLDL